MSTFGSWLGRDKKSSRPSLLIIRVTRDHESHNKNREPGVVSAALCSLLPLCLPGYYWFHHKYQICLIISAKLILRNHNIERDQDTRNTKRKKYILNSTWKVYKKKDVYIFCFETCCLKMSQKLASRGEAGGRYSKFKSRHYVNDLFKPSNLETWIQKM